jgi:dephospho-CoA kinase
VTVGRTVVIGLTGPIGCGKSTVAGWLGAEPSVVVIDADAVARAVLAPGTAETRAVAERFGADLVDPDGVLDRAALGRVVFRDPAALADLEAIVHPAVRTRIRASMDAAAAAGARAVIVEAIKLMEGGLAALCDEVWLVTCEPAVQRRRVLARGLPADVAAERIEAQGDLVGRVRGRAQRVIDTSGDADATRERARSALAAALAQEAAPSAPAETKP